MDDRYALGTVEIEIVAHPSIVIGPWSQSLTRPRTLIIAQRLERFLIHLPFQSQKLSTFTLPFPNDLLFRTGILSQLGWSSRRLPAGSRVAFCLTNILATDNPQHIYIPLLKLIALKIILKRVRRHLPLAQPKALKIRSKNFGQSPNSVRRLFELVRAVGTLFSTLICSEQIG